MVLLDTHVLLWTIIEPRKLSVRAHHAISNARSEDAVAIAAFTLWELALLGERKRIGIFGSLESFLRQATEKVIVKPITSEIAALAARLPVSFPKDPADRLITATAMAEGIPLITADEGIRAARVLPTIW